MKLIYQLAGAGWADARICDNSRCRDMAASYLSDALGDMARAALQLLGGGREASFSFQDDPGEHRWILSRGEEDSLRIRVLWFDDAFSPRPPERGAEVFTCDCTVLDFVGQVSFVLQNILAEVGVEGYQRRWRNHAFPIETFTRLQGFLTTQP